MKKLYSVALGSQDTITVDELPEELESVFSLISDLVYADDNICVYVSNAVTENFSGIDIYTTIVNSLKPYFDNGPMEGATGDIAEMLKFKKNVMSHGEESKDMVHSPSHYMLEDGTEVKMHILALLGKEGFINYAKGNIIKYTARLGKKDNMDQELGKIQEYAQMIRDVIAD